MVAADGRFALVVFATDSLQHYGRDFAIDLQRSLQLDSSLALQC